MATKNYDTILTKKTLTLGTHLRADFHEKFKLTAFLKNMTEAELLETMLEAWDEKLTPEELKQARIKKVEAEIALRKERVAKANQTKEANAEKSRKARQAKLIAERREASKKSLIEAREFSAERILEQQSEELEALEEELKKYKAPEPITRREKKGI